MSDKEQTTEPWPTIWRRIESHAGEIFHQKRGKPFRYSVFCGAVHPTTTNRALPRSGFEEALRRMPVSGPGDLQDLQGPSYVWAILTDPRVIGGSDPRTENHAPTSRQRHPRQPGSVMPGTSVTVTELTDLGFIPLELELVGDVELPFGEFGLNWKTLGEVPDSPGLYAFTVEDQSEVRVAYVGMTTHLWMVTKGQLPGGLARGGQRYGRPRHAGVTRARVNILAAQQISMGRTVRHWVKPLHDTTRLRQVEEELIKRWNLRLSGWNRG